MLECKRYDNRKKEILKSLERVKYEKKKFQIHLELMKPKKKTEGENLVNQDLLKSLDRPSIALMQHMPE